jgi:thiol-disulfide isomerase/thioredoxin
MIPRSTLALHLAGILACTAAASVASAASAPAQITPKPPAPRPVRYQVWAGDLNGDRKAEIISWDDASKELAIRDASGRQLASHVLESVPGAVRVADVDGDGRNDLVIGEGLAGYNPKTGPQTPVRIRIYHPFSASQWTPTEVYSADTERPEITSLDVVNLDADAQPEILFSYMSSKYQTVIARADRTGSAWKVAQLHDIRMGMSVAAGDVMQAGSKNIIVGRPYGDPPAGTTIAIGDAFVISGTERIPLPVYRGVSAVASGDVDGDARTDIVVADGWHMDYGKVARARVAVLRRMKDGWKYDVIEDVPQAARMQKITLVDIDHDGRSEIVTWGALRSPVLEGIVRIYRHTAKGWQGATLADSVQGFAIADFTGNGTSSIVYTGASYTPLTLDAAHIRWDAKLAPAIETVKVDPASLIGSKAPEIRGDEWIGESTSLADLKGKVVLIDFWATWCGPCIAAFPQMEKWLKEFGPEGFAIVGMTNHSSQTSQDVKNFLAKRPLPWSVAIDATNTTHLRYGTGALPHQVLVDRNGNVYAFYNGSGETLTKVETDIRELLKRK